MTDALHRRPPPGLRNGHMQTVLASAPLRRPLVRRRARRLCALAQPCILDAGAGVRLSAWYTPVPAPRAARGLLLLLHGWEGSAQSSYVLEAGARALAEGWAVVRLNLRDHGGSHALNRGIFHSCRIDEAVGALAAVARRWPQRPLALAGYSLGGNFVLRMALRAPGAGIDLAAALAVCPVIDPAHSLLAMERGIYERYFMHKWRASLRRKQRAFPETPLFEPRALRLGLRELTRRLVHRHTTFADLDAYLDGYSVAGDRLAGLKVPTRILTSRDDPVIPVADFAPLRDMPALTLDIAPHGGHCGFLTGYRLHSACPDYLAAWLQQVT